MTGIVYLSAGFLFDRYFVCKNPYLLVFFVSSGDRVQCLQCLQEGSADEEYSFINQDQVIMYN